MFAASAIAANTIMRSLFGAIFPLFAVSYASIVRKSVAVFTHLTTLRVQTYMFEGIGINYGMTLLGCVSALFLPMPFIFYYYGKRIRGMSKFAPAPDITQDRKRAEVADEEARIGTNDKDNETAIFSETKSRPVLDSESSAEKKTT